MTQSGDPGRLADAATPSPLGRLLSSAARDVPSEQELSLLAERLGDVLGPNHGSGPRRGHSRLVRAGWVSGVAALIAGGALLARRGPVPGPPEVHAPPSPPVSARPPLATATVDSVTPSLLGGAGGGVGPEPVGPVFPAGRRAPPADAPSRRGEGLGEAALLEKARSALGSAPALALAVTTEHAARFPRGVLVQEREVIAIEALRRLHRNAEADLRAAAFAKTYPGSAHHRMVEGFPSK